MLTPSALPTGWTLRTCVPISVTLTPSVACGPSLLAETTWLVARVSDGQEVLAGVGTSSSVTYCGPVDEILEFNITDTLGSWGVAMKGKRKGGRFAWREAAARRHIGG